MKTGNGAGKPLTKAVGLKTSLTDFRSIISLVVLKKGVDPVKGLSSKLQKRKSHIYQAYGMIDSVIEDVRKIREQAHVV